MLAHNHAVDLSLAVVRSKRMTDRFRRSPKNPVHGNHYADRTVTIGG